MDQTQVKRIVIIIITFCLFLGNCGQKKRNKDYITWITYEDDTGFRFDLPEFCEDLTEDKMGKAILTSNPTMEFIALAKFSFGNTLISVSVYDLGEILLVDTALARTIRYVPKEVDNTVDRYKLVDFGVKRINHKNLRYKISCVNDSVFNIMYYFMRNDSSSLLYEIKSVCTSQDQIKAVQNLMEEVGQTIAFVNK